MHVLPVKVVDSDPLSPLGPLIGSPQSPAWDRDPPVAGSLIRGVAMVLIGQVNVTFEGNQKYYGSTFKRLQ